MKLYFYLIESSKISFSKYIPHEIIICNDQDPPWMKNIVKELINEKNDTF